MVKAAAPRPEPPASLELDAVTEQIFRTADDTAAPVDRDSRLRGNDGSESDTSPSSSTPRRRESPGGDS